MRLTARMLLVALALHGLPRLAAAADDSTASNPATFSGIDVMSATIFQQHQSSFSGIGLRARVHSPQLVEQVTIMPTLEYWRNSSNVQPFDIQTVRKDATLGVDARWDFKHEGFKPYLGAGFALHFISTEVEAPSLGLNDATDSLIKGGFSALGGATFALAGRLSNVIELKYHHIPDHSQLKINWGLAIDL